MMANETCLHGLTGDCYHCARAAYYAERDRLTEQLNKSLAGLGDETRLRMAAESEVAALRTELEVFRRGDGFGINAKGEQQLTLPEQKALVDMLRTLGATAERDLAAARRQVEERDAALGQVRKTLGIVLSDVDNLSGAHALARHILAYLPALPAVMPPVDTHQLAAGDPERRERTLKNLAAAGNPIALAELAQRAAVVPGVTCKPWCGEPEDSHEEAEDDRPHLGAGTGFCYCTPACRDAGRPLHPPTATP